MKGKNRPKRHSDTHDKAFTCDLCKRTFNQFSNLTTHLKRIHIGIRRHACSKCGKGFKSNYELKQHSITHTGEKPFTCDSCKKSFSRLCHLKRHLKSVHQGIRSHACKECGKGFISNTDFKRHSITHTREKPFTCDLCKKTFGRFGNLKNHIIILHKST